MLLGGLFSESVDQRGARGKRYQHEPLLSALLLAVLSGATTIPPLTIVRQPVYEIGKLAVQAMLGLFKGKTEEVAVPPLELIVRETTFRLRR